MHLIPATFELWHVPLIFVTGMVGEGYATFVGGGGILIQFVLASFGLPLTSVVATDLTGSIGTDIGILKASPSTIWANSKLLILLTVPLTIGGMIGTVLLVRIPTTTLRYVIVAGLTVMILRLVSGPRHPTQLPEDIEINPARYPLLFGVMSVLGIYGNVSGVGSGTFQKLAFISILRLSFADSMGIGSIIVLPPSVFSIVVTAIAGLTAWPYIPPLLLGTFIGGHYMARYVRVIPDIYLRVGLIFISSLYLVYLLFG